MLFLAALAASDHAALRKTVSLIIIAKRGENVKGKYEENKRKKKMDAASPYAKRRENKWIAPVSKRNGGDFYKMYEIKQKARWQTEIKP